MDFNQAARATALRITADRDALENLTPSFSRAWALLSPQVPVERTNAATFTQFLRLVPADLGLDRPARRAFLNVMETLVTATGRHDLRAPILGARAVLQA